MWFGLNLRSFLAWLFSENLTVRWFQEANPGSGFSETPQLPSISDAEYKKPVAQPPHTPVNTAFNLHQAGNYSSGCLFFLSEFSAYLRLVSSTEPVVTTNITLKKLLCVFWEDGALGGGVGGVDFLIVPAWIPRYSIP